MKDTEYTFAVARIRANETHFIGKNEMEQLLLAPDLRAALQLLADQGWETQGALEDPNEMLREQAARMWSLLTEVAPDVGELSFLTAKNDFHNLKAALKSLVSDQSPEPYWMHPNSVPVKLIWETVSNRSFSRLPTRMQQPGRLAYELLVRASDGQRADALLDRAALETAKGRAEETGSKFAIRLAELMCVTSDLKIALRAVHTGRDERFLQDALCECETLRKSALIAAAGRGVQELTQYLSETAYAACVPVFEKSFASFEKWCDDLLMQQLDEARRVSFGLAPLIAYYVARDAEIKNIRILLSCKRLGLPADQIRERMREAYV